jgi:ABC-type uncharacterized transport system auxiliary subunit
MKKNLFILLAVLLLSACAMPETKIYSIQLSTPPPVIQSKEGTAANAQTSAGPDRSIAVLVDSPRHLAQSYIVRRSSPYHLEISKYSKWVSTPSEMVREAMKDYLSSTGLFREVRGSAIVRDEFYVVEIHLKKFEQSEEEKDFFGDILLDVKLISPESGEIYRGTVSRHVRLDDRTFLSLAKGLSAALSDGVKEITDRIVVQLKK